VVAGEIMGSLAFDTDNDGDGAFGGLLEAVEESFLIEDWVFACLGKARWLPEAEGNGPVGLMTGCFGVLSEGLADDESLLMGAVPFAWLSGVGRLGDFLSKTKEVDAAGDALGG
jgi:hypothetical protein